MSVAVAKGNGRAMVAAVVAMALMITAVDQLALYPWMTVTQNVEAVLRAKGLAPEEVVERASRAIRTVGLAGFEEAYPRELSGGMKQRVGMARAFSLDPEMLFMDEPFSQVYALTAESLRAEVIDIWAAKDKNPSSIVMVSRDIKEVVYMADRIAVLDANPGRVRTVVENTLPRPRGRLQDRRRHRPRGWARFADLFSYDEQTRARVRSPIGLAQVLPGGCGNELPVLHRPVVDRNYGVRDGLAGGEHQQRDLVAHMRPSWEPSRFTGRDRT